MKINFHKGGIVIINTVKTDYEYIPTIDDIEIYTWGQVIQFIAGGIITACGFWALSVILFTL